MFREGDNMTSIKRTNRSAALHILHEQGVMSRKRLSEEMKLTPAAITKIVAELIEDKLISEGAVMPGAGAGRREILIQLNTASHFALGILINIGFASLSATRLDGAEIFSEILKFGRKAPADTTLEMICARLKELCSENSLSLDDCVGTGIAIRGIVSADGRYAKNSFSALDKKDYPICDKAESLLGVPCVLSNNVRTMFLAQRFLTRDTSASTEYFLRAEYGIGASLAVNGKIISGSSGQCSEIGHIPVKYRGGKPCVCGKCGCLETVVSPLAIVEDSVAALSPDSTPLLWRIAEDKGAENLEFEDIIEAAKNGDAGVSEIVRNALVTLSMALKSLIYLIDPEKIVLYGRMFDNHYCLNLFMAEMEVGIDSTHKVIIEKSIYNRQLETRAASILAVEEYFSNGGYKNEIS